MSAKLLFLDCWKANPQQKGQKINLFELHFTKDSSQPKKNQEFLYRKGKFNISLMVDKSKGKLKNQ
jgi:hypothetical protein